MPGATDQCPAGQACGNDGKCSERAFDCRETRCVPADLHGPGSPADLRCIAGDVYQCRDTDRVCGSWEIEELCTSDGRTCVGEGSAAHCDCAEPGEVIYVDPGAGGTDAALVATGAFDPPACRLSNLGGALAKAEERVGAPPSGTATVMVVGDPHAFGSADVSAMPIEVRSGIALTSADGSLEAGSYAIVLDDAAAPAAVVVHGDASFSGFRVENRDGDAADAAVLVVGSAGTAGLSALAIEAKPEGVETALGYGIRVVGLAGLEAQDVSVAGASVHGLSLDPSDEAVGANFVRGAVTGSGTGAYVKRGALVLDGVTLEGNAGHGIRAGELDGAADLEMIGCSVRGNGGAGLHALNAQRLVVQDSLFAHNNLAGLSWSTSYYDGTGMVSLFRKGGGVVLQGSAPATLDFDGNVVHSNRGDQVLVFGSNTTWDLSAEPDPETADSCAPPTVVSWNTLACYDAEVPPSPQASYRGLVVVGSNARIRFASWNLSATPSLANDFYAYGRSPGAGGTQFTVDATAYCPPDYGLLCLP